MARFIGGFLTATMLWLVFAFVATDELVAAIERAKGQEEPVALDAEPEEAEIEHEEEVEEPTTMRRRRRARNSRMRADRSASTSDSMRSYDTAERTEGDDLSTGPREVSADGVGGEEQLTASQLDNTFDRAFPAVQRCLILIPTDAPRVQGTLRVGTRIAPNGSVSGVNLQGPSYVTRSEAGTCIRRAVRGLSFPSFDGPPMVAHFPITLE